MRAVRIVDYIYLAVGTGVLGTAMTYTVLLVSQYYGIDLTRHIWLLAIPIVLSLIINVIFIELYRKRRRR